MGVVDTCLKKDGKGAQPLLKIEGIEYKFLKEKCWAKQYRITIEQLEPPSHIKQLRNGTGLKVALVWSEIKKEKMWVTKNSRS